MFYPEVVTGYIPIRDHPRSAATYGELGEKMFRNLSGKISIKSYYETVRETWLWKLIDKEYAGKIKHSQGDNPAKNSLAYHCVQHQKFAWLLKSAINNPIAETFIWIDYGIGHVPGVTPEVVSDFLADVKKDDFAIPGCWSAENAILNDAFPCWRFCGGVMVVPRQYVFKFYRAIKDHVMQRLKQTKNVSWEVNSITAVEPSLPIRWYYADHNETMFTNYKLGAPGHDQGESGQRVRAAEG